MSCWYAWKRITTLVSLSFNDLELHSKFGYANWWRIKSEWPYKQVLIVDRKWTRNIWYEINYVFKKLTIRVINSQFSTTVSQVDILKSSHGSLVLREPYLTYQTKMTYYNILWRLSTNFFSGQTATVIHRSAWYLKPNTELLVFIVL